MRDKSGAAGANEEDCPQQMLLEHPQTFLKVAVKLCRVSSMQRVNRWGPLGTKEVAKEEAVRKRECMSTQHHVYLPTPLDLIVYFAETVARVTRARTRGKHARCEGDSAAKRSAKTAAKVFMICPIYEKLVITATTCLRHRGSSCVLLVHTGQERPGQGKIGQGHYIRCKVPRKWSHSTWIS